MTITLPRSRNSFHFAWLLLLFPPLASITVLWWHQNPPELLAQEVRLALVLMLVVPLIWMRAGPVGMRMQRLLKESRVLLPGCLLAVLVPGLLALTGEREAGTWAVFIYGLGCLLMGAALFGGEFEQRTMATLLGQPLSRNVVYAEKLGTLALLLAFATVNLLLSLVQVSNLPYSGEELWELLLVPLLAWCSGPLFSLASRSALAALIFTAAVPLIGVAFGALGLELVHRFSHPGEAFPDEWAERLIWVGTPVYLVATAVLGWRNFCHLEVRDGGAGGRSSTGLHPLSWPVDTALRRFFPSSGGTVQLIRKELRLHVVPWLVASVMVGLWLIWLVLRHFATDEGFRGVLNELPALATFAGLLGSLIVIGAGAASVAEERELGTLEWQLTQSVPVRRQWAVKVAVTLVLSLSLGILLPALLLWLGFSQEQLTVQFGEPSPVVAAMGAGIFFMAAATSIYASSVSRNTMKATAAAVGLAAGFAVVISAVVTGVLANLNQTFVDLQERWQAADAGRPAWFPSEGLMEGIEVVFLTLIVLAFAGGLLWLGGRNCRRQVVPVRDVVRQFVGMSVGLLVLLGILGVIFAQLVVLRQRESWFQVRENERANGLATLRSFAKSGRLTAEVFRQFNVPTNAALETLADAIMEMRGPNGFGDVVRIVNPPPQPTRPGMDPALARRYGLPVIGGGKTNGVTPTPAAKPAPNAYSMDPVMARRYGLIPKTNPPATGISAPSPEGK